ncbi:MAG: hypothetical protein ABS46_14235 [Cytophagaceae bacterium SCN 52-12]|nr:MAG: hypothetical protein ABS46_14235 [Cytophagaceae bacterium SCN 52-12]
MIYLDTDVLVHYLIEQDAKKHQEAIQLYEEASNKGQCFISVLGLQEVAFVLTKLDVEQASIDAMLRDLVQQVTVVDFGIGLFLRAMALASKIGYQNITDCLHTAIAEAHCTELVTYNKKDFKRIQKYTKLKITIL